MCLVCRYNLDVLYDLKKLHEETVNNLEALINKELDYSGFPKVTMHDVCFYCFFVVECRLRTYAHVS